MTTTIARSLCAPIGHCSVMSVEPRCCHQNGLHNTGFQGTGMAQSRGICPPDEMCQQSLAVTQVGNTYILIEGYLESSPVCMAYSSYAMLRPDHFLCRTVGRYVHYNNPYDTSWTLISSDQSIARQTGMLGLNLFFLLALLHKGNSECGKLVIWGKCKRF